jgi:hypothetical protein
MTIIDNANNSATGATIHIGKKKVNPIIEINPVMTPTPACSMTGELINIVASRNIITEHVIHCIELE